MANSLPPVQPGQSDLAAIKALFDEHPWMYERQPAGTGSGFRLFAMTFSGNRVDLSTPVAQQCGLGLEIEQFPGDVPSVRLTILQGWPDCNTTDGCQLIVTTDDATVEMFRAEMDIAEMKVSLIISEPTRFVSVLKSASGVAIALPIRDNGTKSFSFVTHSLHWPPQESDVA